MPEKAAIIVIVAVSAFIAAVVAFIGIATGRIVWWRALILLTGFTVQIGLVWRGNYLHERLIDEYNRHASSQDQIKLYGDPFRRQYAAWDSQVRAALRGSPLLRQNDRNTILVVVVFMANAALWLGLADARL